MTVLDRTSFSAVLAAAAKQPPFKSQARLTCVVCHAPFDFTAGQTGMILKHLAYGYDFAHPGASEAAAREWIFAEPGYDRPAFSTDGQRVRVVGASDASGWDVALPAAAEQVLSGTPLLYEPLTCWAVVEYRDGSRRTEGVLWADRWRREPGGAEFPEARCGRRAYRGYVERAK